MSVYEAVGMDTAYFESILKMTQGELKEYLAQQLREYGYEPVCKNGFLYAEGTIPVLLVAHLDTVHTHRPDIICRSEDGRYLMSPYGIGGDDRAGVYMYYLVIKKDKVSPIFDQLKNRNRTRIIAVNSHQEALDLLKFLQVRFPRASG